MACASVSVNLLSLCCGLLSNYFLWETEDLHLVACPRSSPETWHIRILSWPTFWQQCGLCKGLINIYFIQFSSVAQSCPTLCDPMDRSMPGLPVHHQLPELAQTHAHQVSDAIQPSHPLLSPSPVFNLSQHQDLFKWVSSSHQVAIVLELQLQRQFFQWIFRADFL